MVKDFLTMGWYNLSQFWEKRPMAPSCEFLLNFRRGSRCPKIAFWQSRFPKNGSLFINYCDIFEKIV